MVAPKKSRTAETPCPVYAIFGGDAFLRRKALRDAIDEVLGSSADRAGLFEFEGPTAAPAEVFDACRTMSLMSPLSVACVRDADAFVKLHRDLIEKYLASPSPTGVLVLVLTNKLASNTRLYKRIGAVGRNIPCEAPKGPALTRWAADRAASAYDCRLDAGTARRLVELVGDDLGRLDAELSKLATYVRPRRTILPADVESLVGASRVEKVFGITDAIARRDAPAALALWDQVLAGDRSAEYRAVGGLAYGFRKLAEAKRLVEQGVAVADAARQANIWTQPANLSRQLDRFSAGQWLDHLVQLLRIDMGAKSGLGTAQSAVEKFIVQLCETPGPEGAAAETRA